MGHPVYTVRRRRCCRQVGGVHCAVEMSELEDTAAAAAAAPAAAVSELSTGDEGEDDASSLDLSSSDLAEFPPDDLLASCSHLRSINVANNHISALPGRCTALLASLVSLDISNNRLKSVADELCDGLPQLRSLVARNNCLTVDSIPKQFGRLSSLAVLNVSGNLLTQLPVQFTELPRLQCLYLGANHISAVPPQVQHMTRSVSRSVGHTVRRMYDTRYEMWF